MNDFGQNDKEETLDPIRLAREIICKESAAIAGLAEKIDASFEAAVTQILHLQGSVIVSGMGKAGLIGMKITATLASTGTQSHFLHPAEAIHGDLGKIGKNDMLLVLSQSGETEEILRILPTLRKMRVPIVAITASPWSSLGRAATITLTCGRLQEADPLNLAPSSSTAVMLALGDALALVVSRLRGFRSEDFARFHPGGALGRKLSLVTDTMRPLENCRIAPEHETIREIFVKHSVPGRRSGAILLCNQEGKLSGIFTDSDLARLFEKRSEYLLDTPIAEVMTRRPRTISREARTLEAVALMATHKISELPVIDAQGFPQGMIDITDIVAFFPEGVLPETDAISPGMRAA